MDIFGIPTLIPIIVAFKYKYNYQNVSIKFSSNYVYWNNKRFH
ncbi:hypothetical protein BACI71_30338 [Bacillus mycoides]|uniref:Uncharacterized protein n=1 Tax=Bacillus mycoides TaxID=1405 RepID=A0A653X086_BACMY|nr:hypothetical protein BACI71_30338 [Bacillus mycoides]